MNGKGVRTSFCLKHYRCLLNRACPFAVSLAVEDSAQLKAAEPNVGTAIVFKIVTNLFFLRLFILETACPHEWGRGRERERISSPLPAECRAHHELDLTTLRS